MVVEDHTRLISEPVDLVLQIELHGALNPAIFRPAWFATNGLLRPADVASVEVGVVEDDFVQFRLPDFLIDVTRDQFTLVSRNEALSLTHRDMVASLFGLLSHTPIRELTISRAAWFAPPSADARLDWSQVAANEVWEQLLNRPAIDRVTVLGSPDIGEFAAELTVEDSAREEAPLLIRCIYSRALAEGEDHVGPEVGPWLEKDWSDLYAHSNNVMDQLNRLLWKLGS